MTILWCGGEDLDFADIGYYTRTETSYGVDTTFSRMSFEGTVPNSNIIFPTIAPFSSIWLHSRIYIDSVTNAMALGVSKSGTGAWIGFGLGSAMNKAAIYKYDGTTATKLVEESTGTIQYNATVDVNLVNYSTSGQVVVYVNGLRVLDYTGDVTSASQTSLDRLHLFLGDNMHMSQIIMADEDTRLMHVKTHAPNAAGDSSTNWTGAYTDIDETVISYADKVYSSTDNADFQCNLTGMPTGSYRVKAVKVVARGFDGTGAMGMQLGVKTNGTVNVGNTETCSGYWKSKERLMTLNPVTGVEWTANDIENLQLNIRAKAL